MSVESFVIEVSAHEVTWRDQSVSRSSYLAALGEVIAILADAYDPATGEVLDVLRTLKEEGHKITLRGAEPLLDCSLIHLYALYGGEFCAVNYDLGDEDESAFFSIEPIESPEIDEHEPQLLTTIEAGSREVVERAERSLKRLAQLKSQPDMTSEMESAIMKVRGELEKSVIRVLVYGATAAGKSTYLNALLGGNYLPMSVSDVCTGSLIYLKHTTSAESHFEVYWRDDRPVTRLDDLSDLHTYTDETSPNSRADEVDAVHFYLPSPLLKHLELIDAPGSRDGDQRRQEVLDRALSDVDGFLYLLPLERGTDDFKQDLARLGELSDLSEARAYVFTKADQVGNVSLDQMLEHRKGDVGSHELVSLCAAKPLFDLLHRLNVDQPIEAVIDEVLPALRTLHNLKDYQQRRRLEDALNKVSPAQAILYVRESCRVEHSLNRVTNPLFARRLEALKHSLETLVLQRCDELTTTILLQLEESELKVRFRDLVKKMEDWKKQKSWTQVEVSQEDIKENATNFVEATEALITSLGARIRTGKPPDYAKTFAEIEARILSLREELAQRSEYLRTDLKIIEKARAQYLNESPCEMSDA